jgi:hypothetical protein
MSRTASAYPLRRKVARPPGIQPEQTIVEDLRSFARDLGVHGCCAMSKDELVETLRQRYLLEQIRAGLGH